MLNMSFYSINNNDIFNKRGNEYLKMLKIHIKNPDKIKIRKIIRFRPPQLLNNVYWTDGFEACTYNK